MSAFPQIESPVPEDEAPVDGCGYGDCSGSNEVNGDGIGYGDGGNTGDGHSPGGFVPSELTVPLIP